MSQNEKIGEMVSTAYGKAINTTTKGCGCSARTEERSGLKEIINDQEETHETLSNHITMADVGNVCSAELYVKKPAMEMARSNDAIIKRMIQLAESKYNCSQIMMVITLEQAGHENADLIRAMSGLGEGCGFFNETCGVMTSASSVLAWYAGKGSDKESESDMLLPMLQDLGEWFRQKAVSYKGTRCKDIVGDQVGTLEGKQICGRLILDTHNKVNEILRSYGWVSKP